MTASRQIEVVEHSLSLYEDMKVHLDSCAVCDDESGICPVGQELWARVELAQRRLKQIGFKQ